MTLADHPDFVDNTKRMENIQALKRELNAAFATDTRQNWTQKLIAAGLPAGPIYTVDQVFNDPHIQSQWDSSSRSCIERSANFAWRRIRSSATVAGEPVPGTRLL